MGGLKRDAGSVGGAVLLLLVIVACAGCGGTTLRNTGFNGSWAKETNSLEVAMYIWHDGQEYCFRMLRESKDGTGRIDCDWDGKCVEFLDDRKTSEYQFRLEETGKAGSLLLHCTGRVTYPSELEISYTHELNLSEDGLTLKSYTVESQGIRYEGDARGMRTLDKISDEVPDPPSRKVIHE
ncbi:MAG: hypothetical protein IFK94_13680 [Acidobacteria bacterium]|uniref:Uncharacterized protein n=1 Tax=Candidatus Polarisedimenticola svalbardensis TaxID=2886004 RepID=A0A8J6XWZ5_9BACT|nr:hypothetical protein [Candidatus Polarisedimenticola svalbardensis]